MTAPRRWAESPDAPVGMRELLGAARPPGALDDLAFQRGAKRLARRSIAPAATAAAAVSIWVKLAAAGAIGLAATGAVIGVGAQRAEPPARVVVVPPPVVTTPAAAPEPEPEREPEAVASEPPIVTPAPPVVLPAPPAVTTAFAPASAEPTTVWAPDPPPRPKSTLADELALIDAAKAAVATRPEAALADVAKHRALYPDGLLTSERDLVELDALRRSGRSDEVRRKARAWLARDPRGLYAARVRAILATVE